MPTAIDNETSDWPVAEEHRQLLDAIKSSYDVNPLPVYKSNTFVEPNAVNSALKNALVEVHFNIRHYCIGDFDSFTAVPLQLIILKDGGQSSSSPYKQKNIREGPMRPKPFDAPPLLFLPPHQHLLLLFLWISKGNKNKNDEMWIVIEDAAKSRYFVFLILLVRFGMPAYTYSLF